MRTLLPMTLSILLCGAALAETYYKWVDKNGVTHYSDRPRAGAERIELPSAQTYKSPPTPGTSATSKQSRDKDVAPYRMIQLLKPKPEEVFVNTAQTVDVRLRIDPPLQNGHTLWIYLDGKRIDGLPKSGEDFQLTNVFRGAHTVNAMIADENGVGVISSAPVTFHVRQTSVLTRPRPTGTPRP